ncbi:MAG: hypothetical protein WAV11_01765 [Minisyncoccia bacterium]
MTKDWISAYAGMTEKIALDCHEIPRNDRKKSPAVISGAFKQLFSK